jgi:enamine deaminase RidA (YjgF/YER057c/UK114 family)
MTTPTYSNPTALGAPLGKYSHVARVGDLVFIAGQVGISADGVVPNDLTSQTKQAFTNLTAALESEGLTLRNVMKFTTYITSGDYIPEFFAARNAIFSEAYTDGDFPANTLLTISGLVQPELKIEIEAVAHA